MRWSWYVVFRLLPVAVVVAISLGLRGCLPAWLAWLATTACGAAFAGCGAWLLRSTQVGERIWRNRVAGLLLPWGYTFGRGRLSWIVLGCIGMWAALAAACQVGWTACTTPAAPKVDNGPSAGPWLWLAWCVDGAALLYLVGLLRKHYAPGSRVTRAQGRVVAVAVAILVVSLALHLGGLQWLALCVAGGPPLALGSLFAVYLGVILLCSRNTRWN